MRTLGCLLLLATLCLAYEDTFELKRALAPPAEWNNYPFTVLILGVGKSDSIQHICTGSILNLKGKATHILTTAYCIQNKTDSEDPSKHLNIVVLVPDRNGTILLEGNAFTEFLPYQLILHPQVGAEANFTFLTVINGTSTPVHAKIDTNDVGIIRLNRLINVTAAKEVSLGSSVPGNGTEVDLLGFGGPGYYTLHKTDALTVIPSSRNVNGAAVQNNEMLFFRDTVNSQNMSQAVETGDEGGPLVNTGSDGKHVQVGIAQGTWRVSPSEGQVLTYASLGPAVSYYNDFIQSVVKEDFVLPTDNNSTSGTSPKTFSAILFFIYFIALLCQ